MQNIPRISATPYAKELHSGQKFASPERTVQEYIDLIRKGQIPGVILEKELVRRALGFSLAPLVESLEPLYMTEACTGEALRERIGAEMFKGLNAVFGETARGRTLEHNANTPRSEGTAHVDEFHGLTIHVQRKVVAGNPNRTVSMGLRRNGRMTAQRTFASVEQGTNEGELWTGTVAEGDVTLINSGLILPNGDRLATVHAFRTTGVPSNLDSRTDYTSHYSHFVEVDPR